MQVYLAIPGEVLAVAPVKLLLEELQEAGTRSTGSESAAAATPSFKSNNRGHLQRWYKGADLMVLRR
jgi:hypothetical protein